MKAGKIKRIHKMKFLRHRLPAFIKPKSIPCRQDKIKDKEKDEISFLLPPAFSPYDKKGDKQDRQNDQTMNGHDMCMTKYVVFED